LAKECEDLLAAGKIPEGSNERAAWYRKAIAIVKLYGVKEWEFARIHPEAVPDFLKAVAFREAGKREMQTDQATVSTASPIMINVSQNQTQTQTV
jgi:hypothetical protein